MSPSTSCEFFTGSGQISGNCYINSACLLGVQKVPKDALTRNNSLRMSDVQFQVIHYIYESPSEPIEKTSAYTNSDDLFAGIGLASRCSLLIPSNTFIAL